MDVAGIDGVLFDLDGTLYQLPRFLKLKMALRLCTSLRFLRRMNRARDCLRSREFAGHDAFSQAFYDELAKRAGTESDSARRWYEERFIHAFVSLLRHNCRARPGVDRLLTLLKERGVKLAVLSDYGLVPERLEAIGISSALFDLLASSEESGALKPFPRSFLSAADALGLDPWQLLVVGDRDDLDGQGARNAGMHFLGVTDTAPSGSSFHTWDQVAKILMSLHR